MSRIGFWVWTFLRGFILNAVMSMAFFIIAPSVLGGWRWSFLLFLLLSWVAVMLSGGLLARRSSESPWWLVGLVFGAGFVAPTVIAMVTQGVPQSRGQSVVGDTLASVGIILIPIGLILFTNWLFCRKRLQAACRASKPTSSTDTSDC